MLLFLITLFYFSPSPSLKGKQLSSQDVDNFVTGTQPTVSVLQTPSSGIRQIVPTTRDDTSITSGSSGFDSLTKRKPSETLLINCENQLDPNHQMMPLSGLIDSGNSESSDAAINSITEYSSISQLNSNSPQQQMVYQSGLPPEMGHSRNSSNTSQVSTFKMSLICSVFFFLIFYELL